MSEIVLVQHRRPRNVDRYSWQPYDDDENFTHDWWHRPWDLGNRYSLWSALVAGVEVARIELDQEVAYGHYAGVPDLGPGLLEIDFFEVSGAHRGRGLGGSVVVRVAECFPGRRLVAFSEEADRFWSGLGWVRYDHPRGFPAYRPLFVAPEGWPAR